MLGFKPGFNPKSLAVERCLACQAKRGRHPWSVASLARPMVSKARSVSLPFLAAVYLGSFRL